MIPEKLKQDDDPADTRAAVSVEPLLALTGPLGDLLRQCRRSFYFVMILTVGIEVLSLAPIIFMLQLFDRVMSSRSEITLVSLLLLVAGVYVLWSALDWIRKRMMVRISMRIDWELAASVFDASFRRYVGRKKVNVNQALGDLLQVRQFLTGGPILALMSAPFGIIFAVVASLFHIYLAIFMVFSMILLLVLAYLSKRLSSPVLKAASDASADASRLASQSLRNSEVAFALGMHHNIRRHWHEQHQKFMALHVDSSEASGVIGGMTSFFTKMLPSAQMALAIWLAISGHITGGMVIAATMLMGKALGPIRTVLGEWKAISDTRTAYDRLNLLLQEEQWHGTRMKLPPPVGYLRVQGLTMKPPGAKNPVLKDVGFEVNPGEILAIIGPSAAGKTSLVKSLVGIWQPESGMVRLDGVHVGEWIRDDLGQYIGYMPQEIEFFEGTVAENIARMGTVDSDKVVEATRRVRLHHMILSFPRGYETRLGENGHPLTGGQKQRLALARAIYGNPRYVVMDEPNASLDDSGQEALLKAMLEIKASGATVVFTTHRHQLISRADKVLILAEGRLRWFGSIQSFNAQLASSKPVTKLPEPGASTVVDKPRNLAETTGPKANEIAT
ncbi:type I secretion system permease/ATPase [Polaromonas eurypsychrophila]|nr:type I secretion system permease/ATPase [Polaromonas eurypsychrophila]